MKKILVANWKMNGSKEKVETCMTFWEEELSKNKSVLIHNTIIFCPPFPFLPMASELSNYLSIGGQNCHHEKEGAFTGEVSAFHLKEVGCSFVIIGHSERSHLETNDLIYQKALRALEVGLIPIICIGEKKGEDIRILKEQLNNKINRIENISKRCVIAYEPLWAIGTGEAASVGHISKVHNLIKNLSPNTPVLYGGSITLNNAYDILSLKNVDGLLVGGASLDKEAFLNIVKVGA